MDGGKRYDKLLEIRKDVEGSGNCGSEGKGCMEKRTGDNCTEKGRRLENDGMHPACFCDRPSLFGMSSYFFDFGLYPCMHV